MRDKYLSVGRDRDEGAHVLITCPPMLAVMDSFRPKFEENGVKVHCPKVIQMLSEEELLGLVPEYDGWIVGDDPATGKVLEAGSKGRLRALVKWGPPSCSFHPLTSCRWRAR